MYRALLILFLLVAICLVTLIMSQQGKGTDIGSSFSAGASGTLFGSSGSGNFMTRMTALLATIFFVLSLVLGNLNSNNRQTGSRWGALHQDQRADSKVLIKTSAKKGNNIPQ